MLEDRLQRWLAEQGVEGARRVVAADDRRIVLSKTPPGFAERLIRALEPLEADLTDEHIAATMASETNRGRSRVDAWEAAVMERTAEAVTRLRLPPALVDEVRYGVESVAALLRSVLWCDRACSELHEPSPAEEAAFRDAWESLSGEGRRFTRVYGVFEGRPVLAHCPGASIARTLFAQGWRLCTGQDLPRRT